MRKALRWAGSAFGILLIGGIGGVLFERTAIPWLAERPAFRDAAWLTIERVTVVNPVEQVIIDEAQALERAVGSVQPQLVAIEQLDDSGEPVARASGIILTADGVVATAADAFGKRGSYRVYREQDRYDAVPLLGSDGSDARDVALFRADGSGWPVVTFAEPRDFILGKQVFLMSQTREKGSPDLLTTLAPGILSRILPDGSFFVDIPLADAAPGSALFTIEGRLLGIVQDGTILPAARIQDRFELIDAPAAFRFR